MRGVDGPERGQNPDATRGGEGGQNSDASRFVDAPGEPSPNHIVGTFRALSGQGMASNDRTKVDVPPLERRASTIRENDFDIATAVVARRSEEVPWVPPSEFEEGAPRAPLSL